MHPKPFLSLVTLLSVLTTSSLMARSSSCSSSYCTYVLNAYVTPQFGQALTAVVAAPQKAASKPKTRSTFLVTYSFLLIVGLAIIILAAFNKQAYEERLKRKAIYVAVPNQAAFRHATPGQVCCIEMQAVPDLA